MKAIFLTLLLSYSCTKYATFSKEAVGISIAPVQMEISHLNEIEWNVGQRKEEKISQSVTFILDLPKIKDKDLDYLTDQRGIDSWIVRVIASKGSETQDLGSLYAFFRPKKSSRAASTSATSSVTIKIYYAAAYASERFRSFKCPAFNHSKKIRSMGVKGENSEFSLSVDQVTPYLEKSQLVELTPSAFNGGNSLVGDYYLEIAPYDSKKRMIHSAFKRIPSYVNIESEDEIRVKSCDGIHPELQ